MCGFGVCRTGSLGAPSLSNLTAELMRGYFSSSSRSIMPLGELERIPSGN